MPPVTHLIHVGFPKAGSTFLQRWFLAHPDILYAEGGIAGFAHVWDVAQQAYEPRSGSRVRVTSSESLSRPHPRAGDPGYRDFPRGRVSPEAQREVRDTLLRLFPDSHVLMVTRGCVGSLISGYSQNVRNGETRDFTVDGAAERIRRSKRRWDYDRVIDLYRSAFGDRLILMPYELLRDSTAAFTSHLERELGIGHADIDPGRVNPSLSPVELRWYPRLSRLVLGLPLRGRLRQRVLDSYVHRTRSNAFAPLIRLLQALRPAEPVDLALPEEVLELFEVRAESLRDQPLYAPYLSEYLI